MGYKNHKSAEKSPSKESSATDGKDHANRNAMHPYR